MVLVLFAILMRVPHLERPKLQSNSPRLLAVLDRSVEQPAKSAIEHVSVQPMRIPPCWWPPKAALAPVLPRPPVLVESLHALCNSKRVDHAYVEACHIKLGTSQPTQPPRPQGLQVGRI